MTFMMMKKRIGKGIIATNKKTIFKQGNKISQHPIFPIELHNLELIVHI